MGSCEEDVSTSLCKKRSFRSLPPTYAPCFVIPHGNKYRDHTFCVPADRSYYHKSVIEMRGMICRASCYGWLILQNMFSPECCLFCPVDLKKIVLPPLNNVSPFTAILTAPPNDPECVVMIYKQKENVCSFCRIGDTSWIEQKVECKMDDALVPVTHGYAVTNKGKIYLFSQKGTVIIDVQDTFAIIRPCEILECISSYPYDTGFDSYYLEARGEIFEVVVISLVLSCLVRKIIVHKLDFSSMAWAKVDNLGDMIFLLGYSCVSVSAAEFGAKGNCIYFIANQRTNLCCFDMNDGTITVTEPCPTKFPHWGEPFWMVPNSKLEVKSDVAKAEREVRKEQETWKDIPTELLQLISQSVYLSDCIRFRLTCKAWMSIIPPVRSLHFQAQSDSHPLPWLISLPTNGKGLCKFYHPIYADGYTLYLPQLAHATVRYAKFGWLLMSEEGRHDLLFFFNPITLETIILPEPECKFVNMAFSSPPTSPTCVVFGHRMAREGMVYISVFCKEEDAWSSYYLTVPYTFVASNSNPVSRDGVFYSLSKDGKLGIFNPKESKEEDMWKVQSNLSVPHIGGRSLFALWTSHHRSFIVECDAEILSVFVGYMGNPVHVYRLVQSERSFEWIEVESLGDKVMFLSHGSSILVAAELKGTENRIYFPRIKESASVFYSLKSRNYHSFGEDESQAEWMDTSEHWNSTWFQTNN